MARFIEIPETNDDLRFAAESIAKIAGEAISAIKELYSKVPETSISPKNEKFSQSAQTGNQIETDFELKDLGDPRFAVRVSKKLEPTQNEIPKIEFPETPREIKIDNALNNLQL